MKTNCWLILGTMIATSAVAQVNTNKLPEIPPPATVAPAAPAPVVAPAETKTNAPAKKAAVKKKAVKKAKAAPKAAVKEAAKKLELPVAPVILVPGAATVAADHVNLRGQAGLKGEVVGHAQKGDSITVISEITLDKPKAGEPAQWAKIALPASAKVWVDSKYIDATNKVVTAKKLNLRGGPGENYSVLGVIEKGTSIAPVTTKENWTQIETPTSAFAFVAASYLKQEGSITEPGSVPPTVATTEPVPPTPTVVPPPPLPPTATTVAEQPTIAPPATTPPPTPEIIAPTPPPAVPTPELATTTPAPQTPALSVTAPTTTEEDTNLPPPPPRVVTHEGTVRHSVSPVAPTYYELFDPATDKAIDYLYTTSTNLNLTRYNGLHITVTGEEALDVRWQDTPVLTIQKIYVLSGTPKPDATELKPVKKHSWFRN